MLSVLVLNVREVDQTTFEPDAGTTISTDAQLTEPLAVSQERGFYDWTMSRMHTFYFSYM